MTVAKRRLVRRAAHLCGALFAAVLFAAEAQAQTASPPFCPSSAVASASTDSIGPPVVREFGTSIDTTYVISVHHQRWAWLDRTVGAGVAVSGMPPAPAYVCAGARASLHRATVVLDNARGRVHVRASLEPLLEVLRRHGSPRENPRREDQ